MGSESIAHGAEGRMGYWLRGHKGERNKGSESIAHEAEGRMGYWLRGHKGERNNFFSKIQLVGQKYRE